MTGGTWAIDDRFVHVADWNGDGRDDLLLQGRNSYDGTFLLLASLSSTTAFQTRATVTSSYGMTGGAWCDDDRRALAGDYDGDGKGDLVLQGRTGDNSTFYLTGTTTGFATADRVAKPYGAVTGDFNHDAKVDLLLQGVEDDDATQIMLADANGIFGAPQTITTLYGMNAAMWARTRRIAEARDFDGDGCTDVLLQPTRESRPAYLLISNCAGGFLPVRDITNLYGMTGHIWSADRRSIVTGDFNGDSAVDILLQAHDTAHETYILIADGAGGFLPRQLITDAFGMADAKWAGNSYKARVRDADGDGIVDLLLQPRKVCSATSWFLPGRPDGTFGTVQAVTGVPCLEE